MAAKKGTILVIFVLVLASVGARPQFTGGGGFSAEALLWFSGTDVTARFTGEMTISGSLAVNDRTVNFSVKGALHGEGEGDSSTMTGVGWGIFTASGRTSSGAEIELVGGLTADTADLSLSGDASGAGSAAFFALIVIDGDRFEAAGTASAAASGSFVPPEDPYSMELVGTGSISFQAAAMVPLEDRAVTVSDLPWSLDDWPGPLRRELLSLLGVRTGEEAEEEEEPSGSLKFSDPGI